MKMKQALCAVAAMLVLIAANLNAETRDTLSNRSTDATVKARPDATKPAGTGITVQLVIIGSSAQWLELGQASATVQGCSWTGPKGSGTATGIQAIDTRVPGSGEGGIGTAENGTSWVTWAPYGGTCAITTGATTTINMFLNTDSVIGNRCYFAAPRCQMYVASSLAGTAGQGTLTGFTDTPLPSVVQAALNNALVNVAATDIRPEDAKFASLRMFTNCGSPVVTGSQYLGLGYATSTTGVGTTIAESTVAKASPGTFHVFDFNLMGNDPITNDALPGIYTVTPLGAVPIVVLVNPSDDSGFGSLLVSNINRATLAGYLDGTYGRTSDIYPSTTGTTNSGIASTVFVREPLSGTYNTMEYAIPNSVELKTSQDLGLAAVAANGGTTGTTVPAAYCNGNSWLAAQNPLNETPTSLSPHRKVSSSNPNPGRFRAIGTGDEIAAVLANEDSLGYGFWSAANFAGATPTNAKYLTVDGIDPIQQNWVDGLVPTSGNGLLGNVTLAHVKDGSYPIWSVLRLVSDPSLAGAGEPVNVLVNEAAAFLSPAQPDFVHASTLQIVRSHFSPPGVSYPCFGTGAANDQPATGTGTLQECGGDVGGLVYSIGADIDYDYDTGNDWGNIGQRQ
ncbi:MAG: hypothetical protein ABR956_06840 [Terracidiphilus sp.]|jgi:hypothetical protein